MAKKPTSETTFGQNPFKRLKGFAVAGELPPGPEKGPAGKAAPASPGPSPSTPKRVESAELEPSFAEEMRRLGVQPVAQPEPLPQTTSPEPAADQPPPPAPPVTEEQLFLTSLGRLDARFADELELDQGPPAASPRRMKQLRLGLVRPEARLDLHGLSREEVRGKVRFFLEDAVHQRKKVVLIITGWGKNSPGEPVLRQEVERYLSRDARAWVVEWGRAPRQLGGDGALVVFLKGA